MDPEMFDVARRRGSVLSGNQRGAGPLIVQLIFASREVGHQERKYEGAAVCLPEEEEILACSQVPQERLRDQG